jgi:hypothetical protein
MASRRPRKNTDREKGRPYFFRTLPPPREPELDPERDPELIPDRDDDDGLRETLEEEPLDDELDRDEILEEVEDPLFAGP